MGRAIPNSDRPTYEQLEKIIRHKDTAVKNAFWNSNLLKSVAWLAFQARDSGNQGYSDGSYTEASSWVFKFIAESAEAFHESLEQAHASAHEAVLSPEVEERDRA